MKPIVITVTISPADGKFTVDLDAPDLPDDLPDNAPTYMLFADVVRAHIADLLDDAPYESREPGRKPNP